MKSSICIVGLGGGGCKVVDRMAGAVPESDTRAPAFVAVNTDSNALADSRASVKIQIGSSHTNGLGAGGDVSVGRLAAEDDIEMLGSLFARVDLVFLVVGLGGGTGTGAAPVVLNAARNAGAMTLCFATLPFKFEGRQRKTQADQAVDDLRESADALIIVPNDRLCEHVTETKVAETFRKANKVLAAGIYAICKLITQHGFINIDFADLRKVVQNSGGICAFGYGEGTGKNKAHTAVTSLLESPLVEHGKVVASARSLLVSIVGGSDLTVKEVGDIMDAISSKSRKDSHIFMGTSIDDDWRNRVTVTIVASDQWVPQPAEKPSAMEHGAEVKVKPKQGWKKRKSRQMQTKLSFEATGKGRFKDIEPTILDGEDLDIPTFVRREIG